MNLNTQDTPATQSSTSPALTPRNRKVFVETWGCQMNVADSEQMLASLQQQNYEVTNNETQADLILLNTCHIREKSTHKVHSRLGKLKPLKQQNPNLKIALTGCVAQAEGKNIQAKSPFVDIVVGPGRIDDLNLMLEQSTQTGQQQIALGFPKKKYKTPEAIASASTATIPSLGGRTEISRFVNIQHGCNNFCTFCVVPFTRGREISKTSAEIISECQTLTRQGAREITLLGQNVNSYGLDLVKNNTLTPSTRGAFADLLYEVAKIPDLQRLRFTTSNPHDFTSDIADCFKHIPKLGSYLHLAVQSGSNDQLKRMKRKVTREEFFEKVDYLRSANPAFAVSTDIIVGFPGETDEDFEQTLDLVRRTNLSFAYTFKYSPRKNTAAARFKDQVEESIKDQRLAKLNKLLDQLTIHHNTSEIGSNKEVLFLYESRKEPNIYYGRTPEFRLARVHSTDNLTGQTRSIKVEGANKTALSGKLL